MVLTMIWPSTLQPNKNTISQIRIARMMTRLAMTLARLAMDAMTLARMSLMTSQMQTWSTKTDSMHCFLAKMMGSLDLSSPSRGGMDSGACFRGPTRPESNVLASGHYGWPMLLPNPSVLCLSTTIVHHLPIY